MQGGEPPRPRGRPRKNPVQTDTCTPGENIDDDLCAHVDRDRLLQPEHLEDVPVDPEMEIGPVDDVFFDSQEEDCYYDDYNDDDEEDPEIWEDGEEVHLQVPPELLHTPDRRGKKRMRMQRLSSNRSNAEACASAVALFASPPHSPPRPFPGYFLQGTGAATTQTGTARCIDPTNPSDGYGRGSHNTDGD